MLEKTIADGSALERFRRFIVAQGGDARAVDDPSLLPSAKVVLPLPAGESGYVEKIDARGVGVVSMELGGGRASKEDEIDLSVGVLLRKKVGEAVEAGEELAEIHASSEPSAAEAAAKLAECFHICAKPVFRDPFIKGVVR